MSGFAFSSEPIDSAALAPALADPAAGGFACFEGRVRDHNDGRRVRELEYEAYEALAVSEGARIVDEARRRYGVSAARCVHRTGRLGIGDVAVWVGAAAPHRAEAFAACRYIIDELKHRLPIWKKEHYADGDSGWVGCARCAAPAQEHGHGAALFDYSRQAALPEVGAAGQARLAAASVLVVGAGGLGCPVLMALAGAGVGRLHVVDDDVVDPSNLHRQPLYGVADLGRPKVQAAVERLAAYNPAIELQAHCRRFDAAGAAALVALADVVVDCSDNFSTKFLVNDAAVLAGRPAVIASVHQYEGQLQVVRPDAGGSCLRCLWPEATRDGLVGNCAQSGVLGPVPAVLGALQAMEVLKLLLDLPGQLRDELLLLDLLGGAQRRIRAPRAAACAAGPCTRITSLAPLPPDADPEVELPIEDAAAGGWRIVDIREPEETAAAPIAAAPHEAIPLGRLLSPDARLDPASRYLLVCSRGQRSRAAALQLRAGGQRNVWSLRGGLQGGAPAQPGRS